MIEPRIPENEAQRMQTLRSMNILFTPAEERFDRITRMASRLLGTPIALVTLIAEQCQWFKSAQGFGASETPREISFCGHAILESDALIIEDATLDPRFADNPAVVGEPGVRFYAGQPLIAEDGSRLGTLCVIDSIPRSFTQEQIEVLRDLAALVETELQTSRMSEAQRELIKERDDLQRKSLIDGLTKVWNREAIYAVLRKELTRTQLGACNCIVMIDADNFKSINDIHGHPAGDAVLIEIASRIRRALREFDAVGRYGGEEFIAILANCDLEAAKEVAERIRSQVATGPIVIGSTSLQVTVSLGLAACKPEFGEPDEVVKVADAALYRAKHNGRNRVEF